MVIVDFCKKPVKAAIYNSLKTKKMETRQILTREIYTFSRPWGRV